MIETPTPAALNALDWQSGTTFTGAFSENIDYYVYARSARNTNYNSGIAQVSSVIKVDDVTGIEQLTIDNGQLKAYVQDGILYVSGLTIGQSWRVYNLIGTLIYQGIANGDVTLSLPARGVYIVTDGKATVKVVN